MYAEFMIISFNKDDILENKRYIVEIEISPLSLMNAARLL